MVKDRRWRVADRSILPGRERETHKAVKQMRATAIAATGRAGRLLHLVVRIPGVAKGCENPPKQSNLCNDLKNTLGLGIIHDRK